MKDTLCPKECFTFGQDIVNDKEEDSTCRLSDQNLMMCNVDCKLIGV